MRFCKVADSAVRGCVDWPLVSSRNSTNLGVVVDEAKLKTSTSALAWMTNFAVSFRGWWMLACRIWRSATYITGNHRANINQNLVYEVWKQLQFVTDFRYLGHCLSDRLNDEDDIKWEILELICWYIHLVNAPWMLNCICLDVIVCVFYCFVVQIFCYYLDTIQNTVIVSALKCSLSISSITALLLWYLIWSYHLLILLCIIFGMPIWCPSEFMYTKMLYNTVTTNSIE